MIITRNRIETVKPSACYHFVHQFRSYNMKFRKIIETSISSSELEKMKEFYVDKLGLEFVSQQRGRHVFLKTEKNMLLIFNHEVTAD